MRNNWKISMTIMLVCCYHFQSAVSNNDEFNTQLMKKAQQLYSKGKLVQLEQLFLTSLQANNEKQNFMHHLSQKDFSIVLLLAMVYTEKGDFLQALVMLNKAKEIDSSSSLLYEKFGHFHYKKQEYDHAVNNFKKCWSIASSKNDNEQMQTIAHPLALAYHYLKEYSSAEKYYKIAITYAINKQKADLYFDYGVTLQALGKILDANVQYNKAVSLQQNFHSAWLNIASLHHRYGSVEMSIPNYMRVLNDKQCPLDLKVMATVNLGIAKEQTGLIDEALVLFQQGLHLLKGLYTKDTIDDQAIHELQILVHITRASRSVCYWPNYFNRIARIVHYTNYYELNRGKPSSFLPFDTLGVSISPKLKRVIAEAATAHYKLKKSQNTWKYSDIGSCRRLHIGYLSYDFNNHPTAHLMEGIFHYHDKNNFLISAYNYGKDDKSEYRKMIVKSAERFKDIAELGHGESSQLINNDRVHILIDAQVHTLGARLEIVASKPAPIIVNYLVYAGTSGSPYTDYFIADRIVSPPEHQSYFTEKLVYLPHCYQVNYYSRVVLQKPTGRSMHNLPEDAFIFANFNKNTKVDPTVYSVWLSILRRVPSSVLWLLTPSSKTSVDILKNNLILEAESIGISSNRIIFAKRVSKAEHLNRQRHANLFLDTFVYGAHSTATDALRGGLPVLTLSTDGFPSRVGQSLLENVGLPELITTSIKEFEDTAASRKGGRILNAIQEKLFRNMNVMPLFQTELYTRNLEKSFQLMWDVYRSKKKSYHIIV